MSGRSCAQCGCVLQMWPIDRKRRRNASGELICDRCSNGTRTHIIPKDSMVSCVHCGGISDRLTVKAGLVVCADGCSLRTVAHDGGDNEVLYHCYAGETEYLTPDGRKTLAETVDTEQFVLTNPGNGGYWVQAHIHSFGEQQLYAVTLRRNQQTKVLFATAGHRWLVRKRLYGKTAEVARNEVALTSELCPEDRLAWLLPVSAIGTSTPSPFGVAHGVVYGDGTRAALGSTVNLWGEKDAELLRFFSESRTSPTKTAAGVEGVHVMDLPGFFKGQPDIGESVPYLYGWLAGYFAADGHVTKQGQVVLDSADLASLEFVERVCLRLGIATYGITSRNRLGFGQMRTVHRVQFVGSTLRPNFFLVAKHRERYEAAIERGNPERLGWTVVSVEATDRVEEVFCAVVPGTETFTLADYIHTGNCPFCGGGDLVGRSDGSAECRYCKQVFTVQVQPPSPAHPQTINGEPVDWPGKPGGPLTPEQEKAGLEIQLGPDQGDELEEGPPAVPGAPGAPPVPGEPAPSGLDQSFVQELLGEDPAADPTQPPKPKKSPPSLVAKDSKLYAMSETQFRAWLPNLYSLPSLSSLASGPDDEDWEEAFAYAQSRGASPSRARDFADDQPSPAYLSNEWSRWSKPDDEPEDRYASRMYMTEDGIAMPEDSFLRRLAVRFADDREAVIEDIRSSRH